MGLNWTTLKLEGRVTGYTQYPSLESPNSFLQLVSEDDDDDDDDDYGGDDNCREGLDGRITDLESDPLTDSVVNVTFGFHHDGRI